MAELSEPAVAGPTGPQPLPIPEQASSMRERFGVLGQLLIHFLFRGVQLRPGAVEHLQQLARRGTIVYVMRYRSLLDYLLVNAVLLREGLPLARFAPGVSTVWFRPLREILVWFLRQRRRARAPAHATPPSWRQANPLLLRR